MSLSVFADVTFQIRYSTAYAQIVRKQTSYLLVLITCAY